MLVPDLNDKLRQYIGLFKEPRKAHAAMLEATISDQIQQDKLKLQEEMFACLANGDRLDSTTLHDALNVLAFWTILSADDAVGQRTIENVIARSTFEPNFFNRVLGTALGPILHFSSTFIGSVSSGIRDMALEGFQAGSALVVVNIAKSFGALLIETGAIFNGTSRGWNRGLLADLSIEMREILMGISDGKALEMEIEKASQTDIHLVSVEATLSSTSSSVPQTSVKASKQEDKVQVVDESTVNTRQESNKKLYIPSNSKKQKSEQSQEVSNESKSAPKSTPPVR